MFFILTFYISYIGFFRNKLACTPRQYLFVAVIFYCNTDNCFFCSIRIGKAVLTLGFYIKCEYLYIVFVPSHFALIFVSDILIIISIHTIDFIFRYAVIFVVEIFSFYNRIKSF